MLQPKDCQHGYMQEYSKSRDTGWSHELKRGTIPVAELALPCVVTALRRTQQRRLPYKSVAERLPVPKAWVWAWQTWQPMMPWQ